MEDTKCLVFNKAFDIFSSTIHVDKLVRYSLCIQTVKSSSPVKIKALCNTNGLKSDCLLVTGRGP